MTLEPILNPMWVALGYGEVPGQWAMLGGYDDVMAAHQQAQSAASALLGEMIFSKSPIDVENPGKSVKTLEAGDNIYCLIKVKKTWAEIFGSKRANVMINAKIDGK